MLSCVIIFVLCVLIVKSTDKNNNVILYNAFKAKPVKLPQR